MLAGEGRVPLSSPFLSTCSSPGCCFSLALAVPYHLLRGSGFKETKQSKARVSFEETIGEFLDRIKHETSISISCSGP